MEYTKLGNSGLEVSKICVGSMSFGKNDDWVPWLIDESTSENIVKESLDLGIIFFDTANVYSYGQSEEILGSALKKYASREEVVIATKVFFPMKQIPNSGGLSRKSILHEIDGSLKRLNTDYVDLYIIHRWDYSTPIEETMETLNSLVLAGKVRYIGASAMFAWQFQKANDIAEKNGWAKFSSMQDHYNLLYREEEREMIPYCEDSGIAITPYSPLASGRLARSIAESENSKRYKLDQTAKLKYGATVSEDNKIISRVEELAKKYNASMGQIALAWLMTKADTVVPIIGTTKVKSVSDSVGALDIKLEELYVPHQVVGALK